jgi:CubicO group peptidase (beta-lactamase class C family)
MSPADWIEQAFAPAAASIAGGHVPGAVLGIVTADGRRAVHGAGLAQIEPEREPLSRDTWFDLASLTKVIFTTTAHPAPRGGGADRPRRSADGRPSRICANTT